ncbi:hypothetical protein Hte_002625 [Hypoxylon texense]
MSLQRSLGKHRWELYLARDQLSNLDAGFFGDPLMHGSDDAYAGTGVSLVKAIDDSSRLLSPSLWIAVYDPTLTLTEALENDYTRLTLVNANGMVAINLGLNYRQMRGKPPAYDYDLSFSTVPSMDRLCDRGSDTDPATEPCFISLWLQFPTFERQVSTQSYAMSWAVRFRSVGDACG